MAIFQHPLWGYQLTLPDSWAHANEKGTDLFAAFPEALDPTFEGEGAGYIMVKGEWNCARKAIEPLWQEHIGRLAGMLGARKVGSAPWRMGGAKGLEAEIVLPKRSQRRMWTGILERGFLVLHFMVIHPIMETVTFEPPVTGIITSLKFLPQVPNIPLTPEGLPLPPGYSPSSPHDLLPDLKDDRQWRAYAGEGEIGALQAFYLREAEKYEWQIEEYIPFPIPYDSGFARFVFVRRELTITLGVMPLGKKKVDSSSPAHILYKIDKHPLPEP